jgi:AbrB family looped-hinge helix DNA binding protein
MVRNIDNLGRVCIPIDMRKELGIDSGTDLSVELIDNKIVITKKDSVDYKAKYEDALRQIEELEDQILFERERV